LYDSEPYQSVVRCRMGVAFVEVDPEVLELLADRYENE
jgi:hypothetical protein